jgi:hypothetical protein
MHAEGVSRQKKHTEFPLNLNSLSLRNLCNALPTVFRMHNMPIKTHARPAKWKSQKPMQAKVCAGDKINKMDNLPNSI